MPKTAKNQETEYSSESDVDLLTLISWREEDGDGARQAWGEFYKRYHKLLGSYCVKKMERFGRHITGYSVEDIVNDTFLSVYESGAKTFEKKETPSEKQRHHIGKWLGRIAFNIFLMQLRGKKDLREILLDDFSTHIAKPNSDFEEVPSVTPENASLCEYVLGILENLPARELDVLLTRLMNYDCSEGKQQFHPDDLERLAKRWNTTKLNIRQILCRTMQKVKESLETLG